MEHVAKKDGYKEVQTVQSAQFRKFGTTPEIVRKLECGKGVDCSKATDYRPVQYTIALVAKKNEKRTHTMF